jgi:phosphate transport system substrate-binding protein
MKKILYGLILLGLTSSLSAAETIVGAGATFPYPFYSKIFSDYAKISGVRVNYQAIGSGGGVRQLQNRTVDFGATDAYVSDKLAKTFPDDIIHIPTCIGAITLSYNLPGSPKLRLSGALIADIYLGKIKRWRDPKILAMNPGVKIPDMMIAVIYRSDGSGTTHVFADFMAKVSPEWKRRVGVGKSLNWPTGLGGKGNPGVAGLIQQIPGSFGYVELVYTLQNNMPIVAIQNKSGNFVLPDLGSVTAAIPDTLPDDLRLVITDTDSPQGYPIASFTWIIAYKEQGYRKRTKEQAQALKNLLNWTITDGQGYAIPLGYAPLSEKTVKQAKKLISELAYEGTIL